MARPTFSYDSAISWADETVKTDIPKTKRIYMFGPEFISETYLLNNTPTNHDVDVRHIFSCDSVKTVRDLWNNFSYEIKGTFILRIYQNRGSKSFEPIFTISGKEIFTCDYKLKPGDAIEVEPVRPDGYPTPYQ